MIDRQEEPGFTGGHNPWAIALTVTLATFMEVLDTSIANVSLPHIAGGLSVSQDESTWVLTSYLVSNAIVLPVSGWFSTRIGRKRFYMGCVTLFTVSSLLCGIAPNLASLIFFRILQGIGGGRAPAERAGDPGRHVPGPQARDGVRHLRDGRGPRPGHRADPGRLHHRPPQLALGLPDQHPRGDRLPAAHPAHGGGPSAPRRGPEAPRAHRLHRPRAHCPGARDPGVRPRSWAGGRLVRLPLGGDVRRRLGGGAGGVRRSGNCARSTRSSTCGSSGAAPSRPPT